MFRSLRSSVHSDQQVASRKAIRMRVFQRHIPITGLLLTGILAHSVPGPVSQVRYCLSYVESNCFAVEVEKLHNQNRRSLLLSPIDRSFGHASGGKKS